MNLPNLPDTERLVLGSVFLDERLIAELDVEPSVFYTANYRKAFLAMRSLAEKGEPINPVTVYNELKVIDPNYPLSIAEITMWSHGLPFVTGLETYVSTLKDKALKRDVIRRCNAIAEQAANEDDIGVNIVASVVSDFQGMHSASTNNRRPTSTLAESLEGNYERWDKMLRKEIVTIQTGIAEIDDRLTGGGLEKGMFHVIGARPGMGKTTFALDMAAHNIFANKVVVFFTMELSRDVLMDRFIAPLAGIPRWRLTSKWMDQRDRDLLISVGEAIKHFPLFVNAKSRTVQDMRVALREVARQTGGKVDLIITDFLTKMRSGKGSKYEAVSENANGLAEFAMEFDAASVALSQLGREVAKRSTDVGREGEVALTDFRDSGEIEELARTAFALWGNDKTVPNRMVNISCLKQGEGMLFEHQAIFNTDMMTFGVRKSIIKAG